MWFRYAIQNMVSLFLGESRCESLVDIIRCGTGMFGRYTLFYALSNFVITIAHKVTDNFIHCSCPQVAAIPYFYEYYISLLSFWPLWSWCYASHGNSLVVIDVPHLKWRGWLNNRHYWFWFLHLNLFHFIFGKDLLDMSYLSQVWSVIPSPEICCLRRLPKFQK